MKKKSSPSQQFFIFTFRLMFVHLSTLERSALSQQKMRVLSKTSIAYTFSEFGLSRASVSMCGLWVMILIIFYFIFFFNVLFRSLILHPFLFSPYILAIYYSIFIVPIYTTRTRIWRISTITNSHYTTTLLLIWPAKVVVSSP